MKHIIILNTLFIALLNIFNPLKYQYDYDLINNYYMNIGSFTKEQVLYVKDNIGSYLTKLDLLNTVELVLTITLLISIVFYFIKGVNHE